MDLTNESIEGIPPESITMLQDVAAQLHKEVPTLMARPMAPQEAEQHEQLRTAMILKIAETLNTLHAKKADLEALMRDLRIIRGYQVSDRDQLKSKKISGFVQQKEDRDRMKGS